MNIICWLGSQLKTSVKTVNDNTSNVVRRSKSVVIQCQTNNEKILYQPFPHPSVITIGDSDNIRDNLDHIKIEIERLIVEREEILRENSLLKFYKVLVFIVLCNLWFTIMFSGSLWSFTVRKPASKETIVEDFSKRRIIGRQTRFWHHKWRGKCYLFQNNQWYIAQSWC